MVGDLDPPPKPSTKYQSALGSGNLSGTENLGSFDKPRSPENTDFVVEAVGSSTTSSITQRTLIELFNLKPNSPIGRRITQFQQPVNAVGLDIDVFDPNTPQTINLDILLADGTSRTETVSTSPTESNASAEDITKALGNLTNINNPENVQVDVGQVVDSNNNPLPDRQITVEFTGDLANRNLPLMEARNVDIDGVDISVINPRDGSNINGYWTISGTSMAAPAVAGVSALLLEGWQNTYSTPQGTTIDEQPPLPSTLRGLLIHTATDIDDPDVRGATLEEIQGNGRATATPRPDYATGWGMVNAEAAVDLMLNSGEENNVPIPNQIKEKEFVGQGDTKEYSILVNENDAGNPLKVTLAWDDVEGSTQKAITDPKLINDLDLELVAPNSKVFLPWQLGHTVDAQGDFDVPIRPNTNESSNGIENIPADALTGDGAWVARKATKDENPLNVDRLNNVEQVLVDPVSPLGEQRGFVKTSAIAMPILEYKSIKSTYCLRINT